MNQQGNVLFIVLIAVVLFGALSATVMRSENASGSVDNETMSLQVYEMIDYAAEIEQAVSSLMLSRGCALTELSFDHPDRANYNTAGYYLNPNSPGNNSCHVFHESGGGIPFEEPVQIAANAGMTEYGIASLISIAGIGQDPDAVSDLGVELMFISRVPEAACLRINRERGITNPSGGPPSTSSSDFVFAGVMTEDESFPIAGGSEGMDAVAKLGEGVQAAQLYGQKTGCYEATNYWFFYHVLLAR